MLKAGLCTITFKETSIEDVVLLAAKAGLRAVECAGANHVEPGDMEKAKGVINLCLDNGIDIPSYGSYYRVGISEKQGMTFESVLETAKILGCDNIRVWAADKDFGDADSGFILEVVKDSLRIADMAAKENITVSFEYHKGSFTDSNENMIKFAGMVKHENLKFYWQPPNGCSFSYCMEGLKALGDRLSNIHVFHWTVGSPCENIIEPGKDPVYPDDYYRHNLAEGTDRWAEYLHYTNNLSGDRYCFLEFVKDDSPENLIKDATALINMIDLLNN